MEWINVDCHTDAICVRTLDQYGMGISSKESSVRKGNTNEEDTKDNPVRLHDTYALQSIKGRIWDANHATYW